MYELCDVDHVGRVLSVAKHVAPEVHFPTTSVDSQEPILLVMSILIQKDGETIGTLEAFVLEK